MYGMSIVLNNNQISKYQVPVFVIKYTIYMQKIAKKEIKILISIILLVKVIT